MTLRVNGEPIPEAAIEYEFKRLIKFYSEHLSMDQVKQQMSILRRRARDQAIGAKLIIAEAERLAIQPDEADVQRKLAEMVAQAGGQEAFDRVLTEQRLTLPMLRESIERGLRVDQLVASLTADTPEPTEEDMMAHFEAHRDEYRRDDQVRAQHILIRVENKDDEKAMAAAESRLNEIRQKILDGADFGDMATAYSDCPSGKQAGGSLGWFSRGMMIPEFDQAVFSMEVGTLSNIIRTPFGCHLIFKNAEESGGPAEFVDVRDRVRDFLRHARRGETLSAHVNELRQKAVIEED